ncbi:MAG: HesB/IscA family protein [Arenicellales bacterium WSBS_2016_MAG_OTU3]
MITLTKTAALQARRSADSNDSDGLALRVAVRRDKEGKFDYAMGFDVPDNRDSVSKSEGIDIIIAPTSTELLLGTTIDYVELEPGKFHFIFLNPNDPAYVAPTEDDTISIDANSRISKPGI